MITPRQTRLFRVANPVAMQAAIAVLGCHDDPWRTMRTAVLLPGHAAAEQLRRTLEHRHLHPAAPGNPGAASNRAMAMPALLTREEWYGRLHDSRPDAPPCLTAIEREVIVEAAARDAAGGGVPPPFPLRPGLVGEVLAFYDALERQGRSIDAFERLMEEDLASRAEFDRGAVALLQQTRFLVSAYRLYRERLLAFGAVDEHGLRRLLLDDPRPGPFRHVVLGVADRAAQAEGLWPADFDLLTRLAGVEGIDVVATEAVLASGFLQRVHDLLPGIEEIDADRPGATAAPTTAATLFSEQATPPGAARLVAPAGGERIYWESRDRESELVAVARRIKRAAQCGGSLDRTAVVFRRPLPYVYLAQAVFASAGVPYQAFDTLPLAAEPYAAALDLVLAFVESRFSRAAAAALLASPHFRFVVDGEEVMPADVSAFVRVASDLGVLGGRDAAARLADPPGERERAGPAAWRAARAVTRAVEALGSLAGARAASAHLATLSGFLETYERQAGPDGDPAERHLRARAAVRTLLHAMRAACLRYDDPVCTIAVLAARVRRWIESRTFSPRSGASGVHLLDAQAARFGDFDRVHVVGLVEGEWPAPSARSVFYPSSLLAQLGWPPEHARVAAERALLSDLLQQAHEGVWLSAYVLEDEGLVEPSGMLEDLPARRHALREDAEEPARVLQEEALLEDPVRLDVLSDAARSWAGLRLNRTPASDARFHGRTMPRAVERIGVRAAEQYLDCPFKFFAADVLRLEEEPVEDASRAPRARGRLLHEVLQAFYREWQARGEGTIDGATLPRAREVFREVADRAIAGMSPADAALERARLLGSAVSGGIGEVVLRAEAGDRASVVDRLLEFRLDGHCLVTDGSRRVRLPVRGVADRLDLLADGTFRLIDYKLGRAPDPRRAVQLPIYAVHAEQRLDGHRQRRWAAGSIAYLAFGERVPLVRVMEEPENRAPLDEGQARFLDAVEGIEAGEFPPRPAETFLCASCPFAGVCRKDYVDAG